MWIVTSKLDVPEIFRKVLKNVQSLACEIFSIYSLRDVNNSTHLQFIFSFNFNSAKYNL